MTKELLKRANELQLEIERVQTVLNECQRNRSLHLYKRKPALNLTVSDYMRSPYMYEFPNKMRLKLINLFQEELAELEKEFAELNEEMCEANELPKNK